MCTVTWTQCPGHKEYLEVKGYAVRINKHTDAVLSDLPVDVNRDMYHFTCDPSGVWWELGVYELYRLLSIHVTIRLQDIRLGTWGAGEA